MMNSDSSCVWFEPVTIVGVLFFVLLSEAWCPQQQQMKLAEGPDLGEFAASMPSDSLVVQPLTGTSSRPAEEVQEQAQPHHTQQHDVAQAKWDICQGA